MFYYFNKMYKIINDNQNKNNLIDEYNKFITTNSASANISKEEYSLQIYEEFTKDVINYIKYNISKMNVINNKNSNIEPNSYLKSFIEKLLKILEMNLLISSNFEYCHLLFINIALLLKESEKETNYIYIIFFKIYINYFKEKKENINYYKDKIIRIGNFLKQILSSILINDENENKDYISLYKKINDVFVEEFLPNFVSEFIESISKNNNGEITLFETIKNFLFYYENIINEISLKYFKEFDSLNWRNNYLLALTTLISNKKNLKNFSDKDIEKIYDEIISKNFLIINKIFSLLSPNNELFTNFFNILLKSVEKYLIETITKESDYFNKILIINNLEIELFNINNLYFFFIDKDINIKTIYHKLIFDIFCRDKNNSVNEIIVNALDSIIRKTDNENEIKIKSNILFKYIDIIPDYENFESLYIHSIINRSIEDIYDYIKEKQFIEDIIAYATQISHYSYKLQTLINNIKRKKYKNVSITIIPSHCYYLYNLYCKPNICDNILKEFRNIIVNELKLSENINLIFQQGFVIFNINSEKTPNLKNISIKSDLLQYSILKFIGINNEKKFDEIITAINLSDVLGRFILNEMTQCNLVIFKEAEDTYSINKNFKIDKKINETDVSMMIDKNSDDVDIDIRINYKFFFEGKLNFNMNKFQKKLGTKHQEMIIQCYIVKFLKMNNDKKINDFDLILDYLQNNLPLIAKINLDKDELNKNLNILIEKGFITTTKKNKDKFYYHFA